MSIVSGEEKNRLKSQGHDLLYDWVSGNPCDAQYEWVHDEKKCSMCWVSLFYDVRKKYGEDVAQHLARYLNKLSALR